jgi:lysozyme
MILDVSNVNPIGLAALRAAKPQALICKATEGDGFRDTTLATHRQLARQVGIPFGSYLFLHPDSRGDEAALYLSYAKPRPGDLQPIIDAETRDGSSFARVAARVQSCAHELEQHGFRPILYSYTSFLRALLTAEPKLSRLRVWQAAYTSHRPAVGLGASVVLWQYTDRYMVNGHPYDASRLYVGLDTLRI